MKHSKMRGSGFKHTLPAVFPIAAVWVFVVVLTAPVVTIGMMAGGLVQPSEYADVWFFLLTRVPVLALAAVGLAIFTTNRVAGPLVALRAALEDVKRGDMDRRLHLRRTDKHLKELEVAFNEMMVALCERADSGGGPDSQE